MRKIVVALSKGGVGKTTTAVNLAAGLAQAGRSVLLIDTDTQGQVARLLGCAPPLGLAELVQGDAGFAQVIYPARPNLDLLAGGGALVGIKRLITRKDFGGERTLIETLQGVDDRYQYAVIDTSPGWDALTINVLFYADQILSPVSLEVMTMQGLLDFRRSLVSIQHYHPELELKYILPTFYDRRVRKSDEILTQLHGHFGEQVCTPIRYNVRLSETPGYGQTIFEYAPHSPGAEDYRTLTERILLDG